MAHYDSDSSDETPGDYTTTNVLLGYASKKPTDDSISQLGGRPTWPNSDVPPPLSLGQCRICKTLMTLLLQLNGDLPDTFPGHERRLYVFACRRKTCRRKEGSVRVIRSISLHGHALSALAPTSTSKAQKAPSEQHSQKSEVHHNIGNSVFDVKPPSQDVQHVNSFSPSPRTNANPFSFKSVSDSVAGTINELPDSEKDVGNVPKVLTTNDPPMKFARKAQLSSPSEPAGSPAPVEPWLAEAKLPPAYPTYFLDADYETLDTQTPPAAPVTNMEIDGTGGISSVGTTSKEDSEAFESTIDQTFQRFADRLAHNPLQVLRYEFRGSPLLYSKTDSVGTRLASNQSSAQATNSKSSVAKPLGNSGMPPCANCRSARVFEFQLTPQAICELEVDEIGLEGMEWGTVIVGVCNRDCKAKDLEVGQVGYLEEWAGVQWEENGGPTI